MLWSNDNFQVPSHPFVHCVGAGTVLELASLLFFKHAMPALTPGSLHLLFSLPGVLCHQLALSSDLYSNATFPERPSFYQTAPLALSILLSFCLFSHSTYGGCPSHEQPTSPSESQLHCPAWDQTARPLCQLAPCQAPPVEGTGGTRRPQFW